MKNLYILLMLFTLSVSAQKKITDNFKYKVTYEQKAQLNKEDTTFVKTEPMILFIGKESSSFSSRVMAVEHDLKIRGNSGHTSKEAITEFSYIITKNRKYQKIYFSRKIVKDKFYYEQNLQVFQWEILPEFKSYKNYKCQKATTSFAGRDYVAWFTMDIPIPEGPYKFNGLPGLIVEINDTQNHYNFEMVGFEKLKKPLNFKLNFKEFIKIDKLKLNKIYIEYMSNPLTFASNPNVEISPETRKNYDLLFKAELDKRNNPIELQ